MGLARTAVKVTAAAVDAVARPAPGLVVLLYHRVGGRTPMEVDLDLGLFTDQIAELRADHDVVTLAEGIASLSDPVSPLAAPVVVTFDDGTADFAELALPVLVEHGLPVTLYVATDFVDRAREFPEGGVPLSWSALRDASSTGLVDVGSHTHSHALLDRLAIDRVAEQLERSIDLVQEHLGTRPRHFAYPKAVPGSPAAETLVRARFSSAALAGTRANPIGTDPYRLARSPVQRGDGMRWFRHKAAGGLGFEDTMRRALNRRRYATGTT